MQAANRNRGIRRGESSAIPHRLAVTLACATFVLLGAGALVTSEGAGMAFRDWPTSDGYNMFFYPWLKAAGDKFIEHGHRLMGATVGVITIAFAVSLWIWDSRRWMGWLGVAALLLVIAQGLLGGMRVRADAVLLARIHGCTGPLFFATTVALAVMTSRTWRRPPSLSTGVGYSLRVMATVLPAMIFLQIVVGAHLRHVSPAASAGAMKIALVFHVLLAALISIYAVGLLLRVRGLKTGLLLRPALALGLLVGCQIFLGMASWVVKYAWPAGLFANSAMVAGWTNTAGSGMQSLIVTLHVIVGALLLAASLTLSLRTWRFAKSRLPEKNSADQKVFGNNTLMVGAMQ